MKGVILSGSPYSVREKNAPIPNLEGIKGNFPLLGLCYGAQYLAHKYGGEVLPSEIREYGRAYLSFVDNANPLMKGIPKFSSMDESRRYHYKYSHTYKIITSTNDVEVAGYQIDGEDTYAIQFHPEVYHSN